MARVRVHSAFLANHAEVRDGLAYVAGGYPAWWSVYRLPVAQTLGIVVVIFVDDDEFGRPLQVQLVLRRPGGGEDDLALVDFWRERDAGTASGVPAHWIVAVNTVVEFRNEGVHEFAVLTASGEELARVPLSVRVDPPSA